MSSTGLDDTTKPTTPAPLLKSSMDASQNMAYREITQHETTKQPPVLRLPPEVLSTIMQLACSKTHAVGKYLTPPSFLLVHLLLVSQEWYRIACGTARLWTELRLDLEKSSLEDVGRTLTQAVRWYERAMNIPISLDVHLMGWDRDNPPFIEFLHALAPRWGFLSIRIGTDEDLVLLRPLFHPNSQSTTSSPPSIVWSNLHTLVLCTEDLEHSRDIEQPSAQDTPPSKCREAFPSLRKVELHHSYGPLQLSLPIPWSLLTSLRLGSGFDVDVTQHLHMLHRCPNLRDLDINLAGRYYAVTNRRRQPTPVLTLRHLERLCVRSSDTWQDDAWMLAHLHLPALCSLTYSMESYASHPTQRLVELTSLLRRSSSSSSCSETVGYLELHLREPYLDPPEAVLRDLFESVPNLTAFRAFRIDHAHFLGLLPRSVRELVVVVMHRDLEAMYGRWCEEFLRGGRRSDDQGGTSQGLSRTPPPPPPLDVQIFILDDFRVPEDKDLSRFTQKFGNCSVSVTT